MKIHHTVGVYNNGQMKQNGVPEDLLAGHIEYNKTMRFGRALFVDGTCVFAGYLGPEQLAEAATKIAAMTPITKDTRPYL